MPKQPTSRPLLLTLAAAACLLNVSRAQAFKQFQDCWQEIYLTEHPDDEFVKLCEKKVKCLVCHQGKKKSNNNPYGKLLEGKLTKKDRRDKEKIVQAIREIGQLRANPEEPESPTYHAMILKGKLPGGDIAAVKKEP